MGRNLLTQYNRLTIYLTDFLKFKQWLQIKAFGKVFLKNLLNIYKEESRKELKTFFKKAVPTFRQNRIWKKYLYIAANDKERKKEFFDILMNDYPLDILSIYLEKKFENYDFAKHIQLNEMKKKEVFRVRINLFPLLGLAIGLLSMLLQNVPKETIIRFMNYEVYQDILFVVMLLSVIYIVSIVFPTWISYIIFKKRIDFIDEVLEYTLIRQNKKPFKNIEAI